MATLRPLGDITQDLEPLLFELVCDHDLQRGEVLSLIFNWITVHAPHSIEEYEEDDSNPVFIYAHKDTALKLAEKLCTPKKSHLGTYK